MGLGDFFRKRSWNSKLARAREDEGKLKDDYSPEGRVKLAHALDAQAKALLNLGRLTGNSELYDNAAERWDKAAKAADKSITERGGVAKMYSDFAKDARETARTKPLTPGEQQQEGRVYNFVQAGRDAYDAGNYLAAADAYDHAAETASSSPVTADRAKFYRINAQNARAAEKKGRTETPGALEKGVKGDTSRTLIAAISIAAFVLSLFFVSSNFTGNSIGLNQTTSNWTGIIIFVIGIVFGVLYFKRR